MTRPRASVAEQKGWKVWLQLADASGMTYPHKQPGLAAIAYRQVVLEGHGFVIREREEHHGSCRLDELANRLLERVIV